MNKVVLTHEKIIFLMIKTRSGIRLVTILIPTDFCS